MLSFLFSYQKRIKIMAAIILEPPWDGCKGYKVYHKKMGRYMLCVIFPDGSRTTTAYARYLLSVKLGRFLTDDEQADHIDEDCSNDDIDNLQLLTQKINRQKHVLLTGKTSVMVKLVCPICGTLFERSPSRVNFKIKNGKKPCCSRTCGGIMSSLS